MTVKVITDSAASIPESQTSDLGIGVVPMTLVVGGIVYEDGAISARDLVERAATETVTTSSPSPGDFLKALEAAQDDGLANDGTLVVTVSSHMSATYEVALTAAGYVENTEIKVLDSGTAAGAQGLVVLAAAKKAKEGASLEAVTQTADEVASKVKLEAALESLDYLARSGRVPGAAAWAGRSLGIRTFFEFRRGVVRPRLPVIGHTAVADKLVDAIGRDLKPNGLHAAVLHADASEQANELRDRIVARVPDAEIFVAPFSSVMIAHTGPGLVGVAWWHE